MAPYRKAKLLSLLQPLAIACLTYYFVIQAFRTPCCETIRPVQINELEHELELPNLFSIVLWLHLTKELFTSRCHEITYHPI